PLPVQQITFSADGRRFMVRTDTRAFFYDATGNTPELLGGNGGATRLRSAALLPDGQSALAGTWNRGLHRWRVARPPTAEATPIEFPSDTGINRVQPLPGGQEVFLVTNTDDRAIQQWELGQPARQVRSHTLPAAVRSLALSADGRTLAVASAYNIH